MKLEGQKKMLVEDIKTQADELLGKVNRLLAKKAFIQEEREKKEFAICQLEERISNTRKALEIVNQVLLATQQQVVDYISDIVSMMLSIVYEEGYKFGLDFEVKRNQAEISPYLICYGQKVSPRDAVGGGLLDVCSLGLRLALWSMSEPRTDAVFVLDEPTKHLDRDRQPLFSQALKELSKLMGVQFIVITHSDDIAECADRVFEVRMEQGVSKVFVVR